MTPNKNMLNFPRNIRDQILQRFKHPSQPIRDKKQGKPGNIYFYVVYPYGFVNYYMMYYHYAVLKTVMVCSLKDNTYKHICKTMCNIIFNIYMLN